MTTLVFSITIASELLLAGALCVSLATPARRIWPPPCKDSWQYRSIWSLTTTAFIGGLLTGLLDWNRFVLPHWARFPIGGVLGLSGLLLALWGVRTLSVRVSLGLGGQLVQSGPYKYTRNPQYLGDIIFLLGYAIVCNSLLTWIIGLLGAAWFAIAPFAEEPWLREQLGKQYEAYTSRVPRFLGAGVWRSKGVA